jgi:hypothetical protein
MALSDQLVASINTLAGNMVSNKARVLRYTYVAQVVTGLFLLFFGYFIGKEHLRLVRAGVRASGIVVEYKAQTFRASRQNLGGTGYMPVVEFQAGERTVRFKDWLGSSSPGMLQRPVTVLYDPANPAAAMIDRPVMNWVPWGPTMAVGAFLMLVGTGGLVRSRNQD